MSRFSAYLGKRGRELRNIATAGIGGGLGGGGVATASALRNNKTTLARNAAGIGAAMGNGAGSALTGALLGKSVQDNARPRPSAAQGTPPTDPFAAFGPQMGSQDTPGPAGYSYKLPDGTSVNGATTPPPAGTPFYKSEALVPDASGALTSTAQGDALNAFRGFTSSDGGTFGGGASPESASARKAWESVSGVSGDKLGDTSGWDAAKWDEARRTFGGIANKDKDTTLSALQSDNPFIKETAQRYAENSGWMENATPTPNKVNPVPTDPYAAFGTDTPPPTEQGVLAPRILTNTPPPPIVEGYRQFTGWTSGGPTEGATAGASGAAPMAPQSAWSGGELAPSGGSASRPSMSAGRFGRFAQLGASPFAQKFRKRFKPLGAPANGFTPPSGGAAPPPTQVF